MSNNRKQSALARQLEEGGANRESTMSISIPIDHGVSEASALGSAISPEPTRSSSQTMGASLSAVLMGTSVPRSLSRTPFSQGGLGHWITPHKEPHINKDVPSSEDDDDDDHAPEEVEQGNQLHAPLLVRLPSLPKVVVERASPEEIGLKVSSVKQAPTTDLVTAIVFGGINAFATLPTLIAFAAIVFKDEVYMPYLDQLCRIYFLSSAIHQTVFCLLSSLPFAVGQVQDVGLIFLSSMASSIASISLGDGKDGRVVLGTSLITMAFATFFTGIGCLCITKLRLAGIVQRVPVPVVGGYLGFVGYFCMSSGIGLGCNIDLEYLRGWLDLFGSTQPMIKFIPTLATCIALIYTQHRFASPLALPALMIGVVVAFHIILHFALGLTLQDAVDAGWSMAPTKGYFEFWKVYDLFSKDIYFPAAIRQLPLCFGLLFVVLFGSAMDIIAIQQESSNPIDFDRELTTVAISNMATAVVGAGATGSYIFSQTVFTMRAGINSRINGVIIALVEIIAFASPRSFLQYVPNFLYGALLAWFGCEITRDWLFLSYKMMTLKEWAILWLTFAAIMKWGLELGIGAGILFAILYFTWAYSRAQVAAIGLETGTDLKGQSGVVRTVEQAVALEILRGNSVAIARIKGFLFFGSAQSVNVALQDAAARLAHGVTEHFKETLSLLESTALSSAPKFLILDFSQLTGIDASGAKVIGSLCQFLERNSISPLLSAVGSEEHKYLLKAHGVKCKPTIWPPPETTVIDRQDEEEEREEDGIHCMEFKSASNALRYCEDELIQVAITHGMCPPSTSEITLETALAQHIAGFLGTTATNDGATSSKEIGSEAAHQLSKFMSKMSVDKGALLWRLDQQAHEMFIIENGIVRIDQFEEGEGEIRRYVRSFELAQGCVAGASDFFLARNHATCAVCISPKATVLRLSRQSFKVMSEMCPAALNALQLLIMRANTMDLAAAAASAADTL